MTMKALNSEQIDFYNKNGYIVVDVFTEEEIEELSIDYDRIFKMKQDEDTEATWKGDWNDGKKKMEVKSIHAMQMHSAVYTRLLFHQHLLDACEDIIGSSNILLHHTKAHLKPPGTGSPFPMHQDFHYFPFEKDSMIAALISLDTSDPENGGLCVYPGSHLLGPQKDVSSAPGWHYLDQNEFPIEKATPLVLQRGQVVIFSYLLIHGSYDNRSSRPRRIHLIQLMSAEDKLIEDTHRSPCQGLVLRGININRSANVTQRHEY